MHPFVEKELEHTRRFYDEQVDRYIAFALEQRRKAGGTDSDVADLESVLRKELAERRKSEEQVWRSRVEREWASVVARFPYLTNEAA